MIIKYKSMKKNFTKLFFAIAAILLTTACSNNETIKKHQKLVIKADTVDATNDFYDNAESYNLEMFDIEVLGEIFNPGKVDLSKLPLHSVIVKETVLSDDGNKFIGAYRYDGYSLYDILNNRRLNKKNKENFKPIIDLYVEVENELGENVKISWGEIFYPNHLHEIIIASKVMRIVPSKTNELWELPKESKLIIASDLFTERNINKPQKITVKSYDKKFKVEKGKNPLFSPDIKIYHDKDNPTVITANPLDMKDHTIHTIYYGRGRGIHSTEPFTGIYFKELLQKYFPLTKESIMNGMFTVAADDGYRAVFTLSEIYNRNDQSEILLICNPEAKNNGIFKLFPSCDFFSDRAVKAITEIHYSGKRK